MGTKHIDFDEILEYNVFQVDRSYEIGRDIKLKNIKDIVGVFNAIKNSDYQELLKISKGYNLHNFFYLHKGEVDMPFADPQPFVGERMPIMGGYNYCIGALTAGPFAFVSKVGPNSQNLKNGFEILKYLIDSGLEVNMLREKSRMTLLMAVAQCYEVYEELADKALLDKVMALLIRHGANVDIENPYFGTVRHMFDENETIYELDVLKKMCPNYKSIHNYIKKYGNQYIHNHDRFVNFASQPFKDLYQSDLVNDFTSPGNPRSNDDDGDSLFRASRLPKIGEHIEMILIFNESDVKNGVPRFSFEDTGDGDDNGYADEDGNLFDSSGKKYYRYRYRGFDTRIGDTSITKYLYGFVAPIDPGVERNKGRYVMHLDDVIKRGKFYIFHAYIKFEFVSSNEILVLGNVSSLISNGSKGSQAAATESKKPTISQDSIIQNNNPEPLDYREEFCNVVGIKESELKSLEEKSKKGLLLTKDSLNVRSPRKDNKNTIIVIPEGVETIDKGAFKKDEVIEYILLPKSLKRIEDAAFERCKNLKYVGLPEAEFTFGKDVFNGTKQLTSIRLPEGAILGPSTFSNSNIESIVCKAKNGIIPHRCFAQMKSLKEVTLFPRIKEIGEMAFEGCLELKAIHIPKGVEVIKEDAFDTCLNLKITVEHPTKPTGWDENWNPSSRPVAWDFVWYRDLREPIYEQPPQKQKVIYSLSVDFSGLGIAKYENLEWFYSTDELQRHDRVGIKGSSKVGKVYTIGLAIYQRRTREKETLTEFIKV